MTLWFHNRFLFLRNTNSAWTLSSQKKHVIHVGWQWKTETFKLPLTCFLCHRLEPYDEPQQYPRKAHLDGEQLLSLSPPGFAPSSVQHHSSSDGGLRHPCNHHAGHGTLLSASVPVEPPVVVQKYEKLKRGGRDREMCSMGTEVTRREKRWLVKSNRVLKLKRPVANFKIKKGWTHPICNT